MKENRYNRGNRFRAVVKSLISQALVLSLYITSMPAALAQSPGGVTPQRSASNFNAAGAIISGLDSITNSFRQSAARSQAAQQAAIMQQQLQPQIIPARFFPQCRISQARSDFPVGLCEEVGDPMALSLAENMTLMAQSYEAFYDQLLSPAQNTPFPVGLQCLEEAKTNVLQQLNDKLNSLTQMQTQLEQNMELFRDANRETLEEMKTANEFLNGTNNASRTLATQNMRDTLRRQFSDPACMSALNDTDFNQAVPSTGLRGLQTLFDGPSTGGRSLRNNAGRMIQREGEVRQHLETQFQRMIEDIDRMGIEDWLAQADSRMSRYTAGGLTQFSGLAAAIQLERQDFQQERQDIAEELSRAGFNLPEMDEQFDRNIGSFQRNAENFARRRFVNECVNTQASTGNGLSTDQILNSLIVRDPRSRGGNSLQDYKTALRNILDNDEIFIEEKMAQIKSLDAQFGGNAIQVEFQDASAQRTFASPFELYQRQISVCQQRFERDETFSAKGQGGGNIDIAEKASAKENIERAKRYLEDARQLKNGFVDRMISAARDRILNCADQGGTSVTVDCNAAAMDTGSENFCIQTAVSCASNIQSCASQIDGAIRTTEASITTRQQTYNRNVQALVTAQDRILKNVQAQFLQDAEFLQRFFPGASFEMPEGMFVSMPEMADSEFGVQLAGGGSLDFMNSLPGKIDEIKKSLEDQSKAVDERVAQYIGEQRQAMEENKARWEGLRQKCDDAAKGFRTQVAEQNAAGAAAQAEVDGKVSRFCRRYDALRRSNSPVAGCEGSNSPSALFDEAQEIAAHLSSQVDVNLSEYANLCAQFQNERKSSDETGSSSSQSPIQSICEAGGGYDQGFRRFTSRILGGLPSTLSSRRTAIENYINGSGSRPSELDDIPAWKTRVDELRSLRTATATSTTAESGSSGVRSIRAIATEGRGTVTTATETVPVASTPATPTTTSRTSHRVNCPNVDDINTRILEAYRAGVGDPNAPRPDSGLTFLGQGFCPQPTGTGGVVSQELAQRAQSDIQRAIQRAIVSAYNAGTPGDGANDAPNGDNTLIGELTDTPRPLTASAREAQARTPATTGDPCTVYNAERARLITARCASDSNQSQCRTREEESFTMRGIPGSLRGINSRLIAIADSAGADNDGLVQARFSQLGESPGTCVGENSSGRGNAFTEMLQRFDAATIGGAGTQGIIR